MKDRTARTVALCLTLALAAGGCAGGGGGGGLPVLPAAKADPRHSPPPGHMDPRAVQAAAMGFADRYLAAMADEYDRAQRAAKTPEGMIMAQRLKVVAGIVAMGNAVDPNPVAGLMDMAVTVTLTRQIARDPWVVEMFGREAADAMAATLEAQEADIWRVAGAYLAPAQIEELRQVASRWREEHPDQRYVAGARLMDRAQSASGGEGPGFPAQQLANSVFGLASLDPFKGLDPALKEVAETRVMAERMFFYLRHTPTLMSWQADVLFDQMLADPQMTQLFADATTVAGSTTRFSDATSRFSDASGRLADTVERFRLQLPEQQAKLAAELNDLVALQREGALQQATTQVSQQRDAAIRQLGDTVAAQQDLLTRNLQGVSDQSIDRAYLRARALILISVGSILLAFVLYRTFAAARARRE